MIMGLTMGYSAINPLCESVNRNLYMLKQVALKKYEIVLSFQHFLLY